MIFAIPIEYKNSNIILNKESVPFTELYIKYSGPLYSFISNYIRDKESAPDLVQESFTRLLAAKVQLDTEARFRNYLYTIAVNLCKNRTRLKKEQIPDSLDAREETGQEFLDTEDLQPEKIAEIKELQNQVQQLIDQLPEKERKMLILKKTEGLTYEDIANITGYSTRNVKRIVKNTLLGLAEKLEKNGMVSDGSLI